MIKFKLAQKGAGQHLAGMHIEGDCFCRGVGFCNICIPNRQYNTLLNYSSRVLQVLTEAVQHTFNGKETECFYGRSQGSDQRMATFL